MAFATTLNFTSANEDGQTELNALRLTSDDRALCLTASGARPLDLLLSDVGEVVALDSNPAQNHLLALKIAAHRVLQPDDLYGFLGISRLPAAKRDDLAEKVLNAVSVEARQYGDARRGVLRRGVWHAGRWERVLRLGAFGTRLVRRRNIDRLLAAASVEEQAELWDRHFDDALWRGSIRLLGQRWLWTHVIGEPGGAFLPGGRKTEALLAANFREAAGRILFGQSDFATLIFRGRHSADGPLPLHMRRENLERIRERLDRVRIVTGDLRALNPDHVGSFSAFSLSDFSSYCDAAAYADCWTGVLRVARVGARFCERSFMNPMAIPVATTNRIVVDADLSARLTAEDRAIIYDIRAGRLTGSKEAKS